MSEFDYLRGQRAEYGAWSECKNIYTALSQHYTNTSTRELVALYAGGCTAFTPFSYHHMHCLTFGFVFLFLQTAYLEIFLSVT